MKRWGLFVILAFAFTSLCAAAEEKKEAEPEMLGWKWANFAILVAGIGYLAVKQVGPFYAQRSLEIRKGIDDAQKLRSDADARAAAMDSKLASLKGEIEGMRGHAREEAGQEDARIRQEAERQLAKIEANATHEIASALKAAQIELRRHAARLAVDLAGRKIRERMTAEDEDRLTRDFVTELGKTT